MHIVQLANFHGPQSGGIRVCLEQLAAQYLADGHRVTLIVPGHRDHADTETIVGADGCAFERSVLTIRSPFIPGLGGYRGVLNVGKARRHLRSLNPDIIELSDKTSLAAAAAGHRRQFGTPIALISHERVDTVFTSTLVDGPFIRSGIYQYNQAFLRHCDAIVCASQFAADEFATIPPAQRRRIFRIPLGVDLATFQPATERQPSTQLRLVAVVRQSPEKDPWLLPATVRSLVRRGIDVDATVYGDGPLRHDMALSTADLPLTYAGHTHDRTELAARVAAADVACAPGPNETFGLGALEILACGTPIVVPERGSLRELITADCGRVARSNGKDFADAVLDLWAHDPAITRPAARRRAEQFTWRRAGSRFLELYADLLRPAATAIGHGDSGGEVSEIA